MISLKKKHVETSAPVEEGDFESWPSQPDENNQVPSIESILANTESLAKNVKLLQEWCESAKLEEDYLEYRIRSTAFLGDRIRDIGIPIIDPPGGHAVYIDAKALYPQIKPLEYPGIALSCELYLEAGIRGVEIGSVMFGHIDKETGEEIPSKMELVRLAIPRRTYTQSQIEYVIEAIQNVYERRSEATGLKITYQTAALRHFTAHFEPLK
ncbi:beta-eliminating lyase-related protein [bacterium]|nr:beta-eliminating lyase-related protein [bacterium]